MREQKGYLNKELKNHFEFLSTISKELDLQTDIPKSIAKFRKTAIAVIAANKLLRTITYKTPVRNNKLPLCVSVMNTSEEEAMKAIGRIVGGFPKQWSSEEELIAHTLNEFTQPQKASILGLLSKDHNEARKETDCFFDSFRGKIKNGYLCKDRFYPALERIRNILQLNKQLAVYKENEQELLQQLTKEKFKSKKCEEEFKTQLKQKEVTMASLEEYEKVSRSLEAKERAIESLTTTIVLLQRSL